jgi:HD-GYP domain-containing protein (c-di-GMP phosphodiesterase class II)
MNSRKSILLVLVLLMASSLFAVDSTLTDRYLNAANEQYSAGNYAKAFSYVNTVLGSYKDATMPENATIIAEMIYYSYLTQIKESRDFQAFALVKERLIAYPFLSSERINRTVKIINTYEAQDVAWGADPNKPTPGVAGNNNPALHSTLELQLALESVRKEVTDAEGKKQDAYQSALAQATEATGRNNRLVIFGLFILAGVCFVVFIVVILNLLVNLKNQKTQNERFVETLKAVSQMARLPASSPLGIEALPGLYGADSSMRMIGSGTAATGLPPPPESEADKAEMAELARKCREIGLEIDQATGRKNNSKNVSEMVFKLAQEMGIGQYESMLFFSVGMVYDIGFLEIDRGLLLADNLTDEQKREIRNHVKQGLAQLSFVPEKYLTVFADGVLMHHENIDGSGYPEGLSGARIPLIARLIRVSESFIALISKRSYREIYDKESAVAELRKKPGLYDGEIIDVLERLI